jgi:hypothetical protein
MENKIDRKKYLESYKYIKSFDKVDLDRLDLSEFFDMSDSNIQNKIDEWKFTGLINRDFILMNEDLWLKK